MDMGLEHYTKVSKWSNVHIWVNYPFKSTGYIAFIGLMDKCAGFVYLSSSKPSLTMTFLDPSHLE